MALLKNIWIMTSPMTTYICFNSAEVGYAC